MVKDVRLLTVLRIAFFSPSKQQSMFSLTAYLSALLLAAAKQGNLLSYVPTVYMDAVVDYLHAHRRTDTHFAGIRDLQVRPGVTASGQRQTVWVTECNQQCSRKG